MYATDLADAVLRAADDIENIPDMINIGVGHDHSINEYYAAVANMIGWEGEFTHDLSKPTGMARKLSDTTRQADWGWHPPTSLEDGIAKTIEFYSETLKP